MGEGLIYQTSKETETVKISKLLQNKSGVGLLGRK